jgi:hypothetical protein
LFLICCLLFTWCAFFFCVADLTLVAPKPAPKSTQKPSKNQEIDDQIAALSQVVEKVILEKENLVQMNRYAFFDIH